jgi:type I restriction-modification system DNA methylase subunit
MTSEELKRLEATLWQTADTLRANSDLKSSECSTPVLGLIFLKFADNYDDVHDSFGRFDYVLANPPFNVDDVNLAKVEADRRFNTYGIPRNKTGAKAKDKGSVTRNSNSPMALSSPTIRPE